MEQKTLTLGLIPSPDMPEELVNKMTETLAKDLKKHIDANVTWQIEVEVDPLTGTAEKVNTIVEKAYKIKEEHNWDYTISLTDLPIFANHKAVTADVSFEKKAGLVSLPSFGAFPLKKRIRKALTFVMDLMYDNKETAKVEKEPTPLTSRFLLSKINRIETMEDQTSDARFIVQSSIIGWLRILSGMTFANRPWKALGSFKSILALSFATGTYISIFSTPWELSVTYSPLRLFILMLISIISMVFWFIVAHKLWEKPSMQGKSQYRKLYNFTTITTLTIVAIIIYLTLFAIIMISLSIFVSPDIFEEWSGKNTDDTVLPFFTLAWFVTSLGFLAGAIGSTAEKEENVRNITYCYRQLNRKKELEQNEDESSSAQSTSEQTLTNERKEKPPHTTTIGLIAAPELAEDLSKELVERLPDLLSQYISSDINWEVERVADSLIGGAETSKEIFSHATTYRESREWDYLISLTDLPIFHEKYIVAVDIEENNYSSLISIPAFGWRPVFKRIEKVIIQITQQMISSSGDTKEQAKSSSDSNKQVKNTKLLRKQFPISTVRKIQTEPDETSKGHTKYIVVPRFNGSFRLLSGMTFANNPFQLMPSLTNVIAISFTTGAFGLIFTTMWKLSYYFSDWRLLIITLASIFGMTIWVIISHELWEPKRAHLSSQQPKRMRRLYNTTTFSTILIAIISYYIIIFLLFFMITNLFIPKDFLTETLSMDEPAGVLEYMQLAWLAASVSTIAGGIGAGLENEELVRDATYSYRQRKRYESIHKKSS